jgi:outer membrane protein assembly factor BamB
MATAPVVDGRVVFGDKVGWLYLLSADDGSLIQDLKLGENFNATPAILNGRIYVGVAGTAAKLFCIGAPDA